MVGHTVGHVLEHFSCQVKCIWPQTSMKMNNHSHNEHTIELTNDHIRKNKCSPSL